MELALIGVLFIASCFMYRQHSKITRLQEVFKGECLEMINLEIPKTEEDDSSKIGINARDGKAERQRADEEKERDEARLKELHAKIPRSFVGSKWIYKQNQLAYITIMASSIFRAMVWNNIMDVPGLLIILLIVAFYQMRKDISAFYRPFSFF